LIDTNLNILQNIKLGHDSHSLEKMKQADNDRVVVLEQWEH